MPLKNALSAVTPTGLFLAVNVARAYLASPATPIQPPSDAIKFKKIAATFGSPGGFPCNGRLPKGDSRETRYQYMDAFYSASDEPRPDELYAKAGSKRRGYVGR